MNIDLAKLRQSLSDAQSPLLAQLRTQAYEFCEHHGFPNSRNEAWRYSYKRAKSILDQAFHVVHKTPKLTEEYAALIDPYSEHYTIILLNGHYIQTLSCIDHNAFNVEKLIDAFNQCPSEIEDVCKRYFPQWTDGFAALNYALLENGCYITINAYETVKKPIHIIHFYDQPHNIINTQHWIIANEKSQAQIIEHHLYLTDDSCFTNHISQIIVNKHAQLTHYKLINTRQNSCHIDRLQVVQNAHSQFNAHSFAHGGRLVRSDSKINLMGDHASCILQGLFTTNEQQHLDHHTLIHHQAQHTASQQIYKGIITDRSQATFNGKIIVDPHAQKTSAQQYSKNLLLSRHAEINTKPELEIYADDVQCAHGATVGQLDENALFYLRSRGLMQAEAEQLLLQAFANEMIEYIQDLHVRELAISIIASFQAIFQRLPT